MRASLYILLSVFGLALALAELNSDAKLFKKYPDSCTTAKAKKNGIYKIQIKGGEVMSVYCDVSVTGSPWLVIQRRVDVNINFYRDWKSYQQGFGDLQNSFFIGLDKLNALTVAQPQELYIHMEDFMGQTRYARYSSFAIGNSANLYGLNSLGSFSGTAEDSLSIHLGMKFSTYDWDNDKLNKSNCAVQYTGAWWYNDCHSRLVDGQIVVI